MKLFESICWFLSSGFERFDRAVPIYGGFPSSNRPDSETRFENEYAAAPRDMAFFNPFVQLAGKKVLDIGCGFGGKSAFYSAQGADVTGVDIVEYYILNAQQCIGKYDSRRLRFIVADGSQLPFGDDSFDVVLSSDLMEHISQPVAMLLDSLRVLDVGGLLYINFGPLWLSPGGGHIGRTFPWMHLLFSEDCIKSVMIKQGKLFPQDSAKSLYAGVNKMTVKRFEKILAEILATNEVEMLKYQLWTKDLLKPLLWVPGLRELLGVRIIVILRKKAPRVS